MREQLLEQIKTLASEISDDLEKNADIEYQINEHLKELKELNK